MATRMLRCSTIPVGMPASLLRLMARGLDNEAIAGRLVVSDSTVKTHVAHILDKLGVETRVQAVVAAYESHLVSPAEPTL
jgi:DNA-binding NarL/FixJ family response regulator